MATRAGGSPHDAGRATGAIIDELVRQRRALRQLDESFLRYYMAVLDERRSSV